MALFIFVSVAIHGVDFHFCGGDIADIGLFGKAEKCSKKENVCESSKTNRSQKEHLEKTPCCKELIIKTDIDHKKNTADLVVKLYNNISVIPEVDCFKIFLYKEEKPSTINGPPIPFFYRDILSLFQVYII